MCVNEQATCMSQPLQREEEEMKLCACAYVCVCVCMKTMEGKGIDD